MKNISKIVVSVLPAICGSTYDMPSCNAGDLLRSIQHEQSKLQQVTQHQVMQNVFKNYNNLNKEVKDILDILWHNDAGNLLLRRLYKNIKDETQRITILWNTCDEKDESNYFLPFDLTVLLDQNKLGWEIGYCNGIIDIFSGRMDMVIFHELCHALHELENVAAYKRQNFIPMFYKLSKDDEICKMTCKAWEDDEEIRTITGCYIDNGKLKFDCLNTNSYIILEELKKGTLPKKIQQRVYHCDYPTLTTKCRLAKKLSLDSLVIPLDKYVDKQETTCYSEEWVDLR